MKSQPKIFLLLMILPTLLWAQEEKEKLGDKEYIIVKDYKPVLGESLKLSETPEGDTTTVAPPEMNYSIRSRKAVTEYETSTIKAVKIKDEQLERLYRSFVRLGIGNYTTYKGDLYLNALRSKRGALGLALNHHSGNPGLKDAGPAGFSRNHGGVFGKYFLENSTFSGEVNYDRDVVHYYGYDTNDTIINKSDLKQRFNTFGVLLGFGSNYLSRGNIDYNGSFGFSTLNDLYDVTENDLIFSAKAGKMISEYYVNAEFSLNYFNKSVAKGETLALYNDLNRSIVTIVPTIFFNKDKVNMTLGLNLGIEKNLNTKVHLFPRIDINVPIVENVLYAFGGANGNVVKNNYHTIVQENPFVTSSIVPFNTINKLELKAGFNGNFSTLFSFVAQVKYTTVDRMQLFYNDLVYFNKFDALYIDGKVLNLHAELAYNRTEKFSATLRFDQYSYSMDLNEKAWHRPNSEVVLSAKYNIWDKLILHASIYASGKYDVRFQQSLGYTSEKVKGYTDLNLGVEYRYSKILSFYVNMNNLGFSRYYRWYNYPSERFNILGGLTYSF
jgi:hypothetical protein